MSKGPVLDPRRREDIMDQLAALARSYTPEWRYQGDREDPGAALAEIFGDMFYQTVDRMNSLPEKLYAQFLNMAGFRMPGPVSAQGLMRFTAHETVDAPVPVPQGTQVFAEGEDGENIVYETERAIESTPAQLTALFYVDPRQEVIEALELDRPRPFFAPAGGENLQRHRLSFGREDVLTLSGPCVVEVELRQPGGFSPAETVGRLADPQLGRWSFRSGEEEIPFTAVAATEGGTLELRYDGDRAFLPRTRPEEEPEETGEESGRAIFYQGDPAGERLVLDGIALKSRPAGRVPVDGAACGDVPLDLERGDYCLGRRPAAYNLCYLRSDQVFSKRGARVDLRLDIVSIVTDPPDTAPQYQFNQRVIDKRDAVTVTPDDVYVEQVAWEYYNGAGWRALKVTGDQNPFSGKKEGPLELVFDVPEDLEPVEVNAQEGCYIRARVVYIANEFSPVPRWVVPFLRGADCAWSYPRVMPADWCQAENNGERTRLEDVSQVAQLGLEALIALEDTPAAMYLCFDRSPNAMPLSLYFDVAGRARLEDKLRFEAWTGSRFEPVRWVDLTRNLLHPGVALLYLPEELPSRRLFGVEGHWLRLCRSSYQPSSGGVPWVKEIELNIVQAVQREVAEEERYSTEVYEAGKTLRLLYAPVLDAQVWVDEVGDLPVAEAQRLAEEAPDRVRLEWDDRVLTHCWVCWERTEALALRGAGDRSYELDPYGGVITFGDGTHGRVPPAGLENLSVRYAFGGGSRGNLPAGAVTGLVGALPRISQVENLTPMSGGTDRLTPERAEGIANRALRNRGRALGSRDFEEIVSLRFPQARHVKCFPNRDERGGYAPGHVSVVVESVGADSRRMADDLCQRIYDELARRCDCVLLNEGRLHVVGSTVITVNSDITVEMADPDQSAATQQEIARRLEELIDSRWRERDIGSQLRLDQVWQVVRDTPNVRLVRTVLLEGHYDQDGVERVTPLEDDDAFPYATVKSGVHLIRLT